MSQIKNYKMYIDGKWIESSSGKKIETLNPENNKVWATVPEANEKDVNLAVNAAQKAFENSWSKMHPRDRAKYLRELANQLRQNAEHLGKIETIDTGKLFRETKTQANYIAEYYDYFAKHKLIILQNTMITLQVLQIKLRVQLFQLIKIICKWLQQEFQLELLLQSFLGTLKCY